MAPDPYPTWSEVREVGPRDGLQNEEPISVHERIELIDALSATGLRAIEVGSFVRADAIPAMADTDKVIAGITRAEGVRYRALVPNLRGADAAIDAGVDELEVVLSVSATHNGKNLKMTVDDSIAQIAAIVGRAAQAGVPVEAILATSFGCPYEGKIEPGAVLAVAEQLRERGVGTFSFADTTGMATPPTITALLDAVVVSGWAADSVALHLHNTRGTGLANLVVAAQRGVTRFDASVGGLGGCPFAPGATGNVPTEDVVHLLDSLGMTTGVNIELLIEVALDLEQVVGRALPGQVMRSGPWYRLPRG